MTRLNILQQKYHREFTEIEVDITPDMTPSKMPTSRLQVGECFFVPGYSTDGRNGTKMTRKENFRTLPMRQEGVMIKIKTVERDGVVCLKVMRIG